MDHREGIVIAGTGRIGSAALRLLATSRPLGGFRVFCGDEEFHVARRAAAEINNALGHPDFAEGFELKSRAWGPEAAYLRRSSVVLDCLPGAEAPRLAARAVDANCHYVNLTEYLDETQEIEKRFSDASTALVLQTGLAPGFVNVLANRLYHRAIQCGIQPDSIKMRVGALPACASGPHYYGTTWSPIGVATEYLEPTEVLRNGTLQRQPSLSGRERIILDGEVFEEALTSGGAADLPRKFERRVRELDYKTLRYPGHYDWVDRVCAELPEVTAESLSKVLATQVPEVTDDRVIVYAAVEGNAAGERKRLDRRVEVRPAVILGQKLSAIARATAASLVQVGLGLLDGSMCTRTGTVYQTDIDAEAFLTGDLVRKTYFEDGEEPITRQKGLLTA